MRRAVTDGEGLYRIVDLRPGTYSVTFTLTGFSTVTRDEIQLTSGFNATVNADLRLGPVEETVTVSGASSVVDVQNVRSQNVLSAETLSALPTFKNLQGIATLTVGATVRGSAGSIHDVGGNKGEQFGTIMIHGSRPDDTRLDFDGMRYQNMYGTGGGPSRLWFVNQVAVQETVVETAGVSAETENGGVHLNAVPKDGGNTFSVYGNTTYTSKALQQNNLNDTLRARGFTTPLSVRRVYDFGVGLGGPVMRDRVWFYTSHRKWGNSEYGRSYFNATPHTMVYTPDLSRDPSYTDYYQQDHSLRLTWQAAPKHKIAGYFSKQRNCQCNFFADTVFFAPEAMGDYKYHDTWLAQGTWTYFATSQLLFEAGGMHLHQKSNWTPQPGVLPTDISVTELSNGFTYNSFAAIAGGYTDKAQFTQSNQRFAMSYITGAHALKVGLFMLTGVQNIFGQHVNEALSYQFRFGVPVLLTQWATPLDARQTVKLNLGTYVQDQWTLNPRVTLNLGVRFDYLNAYVPEQDRPAGRFVGALHVRRVDNVPNWKDVSPRLGVAYAPFTDGRTAVKVSLGRYVAAQGAQLAALNNPANAIVGSAARTWSDANNNFIPDCNLLDPGATGECGGLSNSRFGTVFVNTVYSPDVVTGRGSRPFNWQASAAVQHELRRGMAFNVGYFRTWFGNFTVTDNVLVTPVDYDPFCIAAPMDARLPGGGGNQLCGLYDVQRPKFGQVSNLVTFADRYGTQTEVFNGVDVTINARYGNGGLLLGGVSVGRTVADNCFAVDSPQQQRPGYCHLTPPWSAGTQAKVAVTYPLPRGLQASAIFQNLPGIPIAASYVATNIQIAPSLGRNLAACPTASGACTATAAIDIIPPQTMFEDRLSQLDLRFAKTVQIGRARLQGMFDIYNVFNNAAILGIVTRYGPTWLTPGTVQGARLFKFGAELKF